MTPYQTQCVYDALQYARDHEAKARGYEEYMNIYVLYKSCVHQKQNPHEEAYKAIQLKVEPLFLLWLNKGNL